MFYSLPRGDFTEQLSLGKVTQRLAGYTIIKASLAQTCTKPLKIREITRQERRLMGMKANFESLTL